jgi:hypothetical protein
MFKNKEDMMEDAIISAGVTAIGVAGYHYFVVKDKLALVDAVAKSQTELADSVKNVLNQVQITGNTVGALAASFNSLKAKLESYGLNDDSAYGYTDSTGTQVGGSTSTVPPVTTTKREYKGEAIRAMRKGYVAALEKAADRRPLEKREDVVNVYRKQE